MPCRYYTEAEEVQMSSQRAVELSRALDEATAAACEMSTHVSPNLMSFKTRKWIREHLEMDKKRKKKDAATSSAKPSSF